MTQEARSTATPDTSARRRRADRCIVDGTVLRQGAFFTASRMVRFLANSD